MEIISKKRQIQLKSGVHFGLLHKKYTETCKYKKPPQENLCW